MCLTLLGVAICVARCGALFLILCRFSCLTRTCARFVFFFFSKNGRELFIDLSKLLYQQKTLTRSVRPSAAMRAGGDASGEVAGRKTKQCASSILFLLC